MNEKMKLIIGYDGSNFADNALEDLPRAGLPREAEALIVNVKESWLPMPSNIEIAEENFSSTESAAAVKTSRAKEKPEIETPKEVAKLLEIAGKKVNFYFPDWQVETRFSQGSPSFQILRRAAEQNADLIIVGSQGNGENKSLALGSVAQKVANEAECSVRVVRGSVWKKGAPSRILIGLDGTLAAEKAVAEVGRRMWMMGSEVRLVIARESSKTGKNKAENQSAVGDWINSFIEQARQVLQPAALAVSQIVEEGDPRQIIVRAAAEWGADGIFIGSNDTGNFHENFLLGSVATAIVARAHCTVEVVRQSN